jgi:hypothetical protein
MDLLKNRKRKLQRWRKSSKEFLAFVDGFCVFMIQQGEATTQNQEITKLMNFIAEGLGAIDNAPSGHFAKATIKVRLLNSFVRKETKVEVYMETQHFKNRQGANSFHSNPVEGTRVGVVDVPEAKNTQPI